MNVVNGLLFLSFVCFWRQAICQSSISVGLSFSSVPTNTEASTLATEGSTVVICFDPRATPNTASAISVKTRDGTAMAPGDYAALETDLTFTKDEPQCVSFSPNLDVEDEGGETFTVQVTGTSGDYANVNAVVTVTINDQDVQGPTISIENDNYYVSESAGEVEVCAAYYGTQPLASDATVRLRTDENPTFPGSSPASPGSDYTPESGDLTFPAGSVSGTRRCITIKITDDSSDEEEETIQLLLTTSGGVTLGPNTSSTVRITDAVTPAVTPGGSGDGGDGGDNGTPSTGGTGGVGNENGVNSTHNSLSVLLLVLTVVLAVLNTQ